jgi:hypothetical protein
VRSKWCGGELPFRSEQGLGISAAKTFNAEDAEGSQRARRKFAFTTNGSSKQEFPKWNWLSYEGVPPSPGLLPS